MREYGRAIRFTKYEGLHDGVESLKKVRDETLDYLTTKMVHSTCHEPWMNLPASPDPDCYFCGWAFKLSRFFYGVWWWQTLCTGCDRFMWRCNYSCDLWEDY